MIIYYLNLIMESKPTVKEITASDFVTSALAVISLIYLSYNVFRVSANYITNAFNPAQEKKQISKKK